MAVASFQRPGELIGPKGFPAPKQSSLKHWYRAARVVIPELPEWTGLTMNTKVDVETIIFDLHEGTLYIARKRHLR